MRDVLVTRRQVGTLHQPPGPGTYAEHERATQCNERSVRPAREGRVSARPGRRAPRARPRVQPPTGSRECRSSTARRSRSAIASSEGSHTRGELRRPRRRRAAAARARAPGPETRTGGRWRTGPGYRRPTGALGGHEIAEEGDGADRSEHAQHAISGVSAPAATPPRPRPTITGHPQPKLSRNPGRNHERQTPTSPR